MKKETTICKVHKENNIIHLEFNESATLTFSDLNEMYDYIEEVYDTNLPKLIDVRANLTIEEKAKQFFKNQSTKNKIAKQGILTGKNTSWEILNIFIGMESEKTPIRIFIDYSSAIAWLNSEVSDSK